MREACLALAVECVAARDADTGRPIGTLSLGLTTAKGLLFRDRQDDIAPLAQFFLEQQSQPFRFSPEALDALRQRRKPAGEVVSPGSRRQPRAPLTKP